MEFSIQRVHDGTAKLKCWSYSITRLIESKRVKHCLNKPPRDLQFVLLCRIVQGNYLRLKRMTDPEKYQETTAIDFSIQYVHDGTEKIVLHLLYYKTHRVQKGGALFGKPAAKVKTLAGWKSPAHLFLLLRLSPRSGRSTTSSRSALRIGLPRQLTRPGQSPGRRCADEPAGSS